MTKRKTEWHRECIRCGKDYVATGKFSRVCITCDVNKAGSKQLRVDENIKKELDETIEELKRPGITINYNALIKGYIKLIKEFDLKDKLKKIILGRKEKEKS